MHFPKFLAGSLLFLTLAVAAAAAPQPMEQIAHKIKGGREVSPLYSLQANIQILAEFGVASWYVCPIKPEPVLHRKLRIKDKIYPAAHKTLPFGTLIKVINPANGKKILCRVVDRGPFISGRIIDLDAYGSKALGISGVGRIVIKIFRLSPTEFAMKH